MKLASSHGGSFRGSTLTVDGTPVHRFLGIPYAKPPVRERRFRPPAPTTPLTGVLDCTRPGPAAPQSPESPAPPGAKPRVWSEEGCLNLNIWTPGTDGSARPVMVWIHGGAYLSGSNNDGMYDGAGLAAASGAVVVAINYRLGALGFLHLADLLGAGYQDSSNLALLDQIEALRWVRGTIEAFGGDPHNVTLFGESAGAAAIGTLLGMPASGGLFRRAIMQSGTAERCRTAEGSARISRKFLALCGLGTSSAADMLTLPVDRLLEAQEMLVQDIGQETFAVPLPFQPTAGTPSLPRPPLDAVQQGQNGAVDLLIGTNLNEGSFAVEMRPPNPADPDYAERAALVLAAAGISTGAHNGLRRSPDPAPLAESCPAAGSSRQGAAGSCRCRFRLPSAEQQPAGRARTVKPPGVPGTELLLPFHLAQPCNGRKARLLPCAGRSLRLPSPGLAGGCLPDARQGSASPQRHHERRLGVIRAYRNAGPTRARVAGVRAGAQHDDP